MARCTLGTGKLRFPRSRNVGDDAHEPRRARLCLPSPLCSVGYTGCHCKVPRLEGTPLSPLAPWHGSPSSWDVPPRCGSGGAVPTLQNRAFSTADKAVANARSATAARDGMRKCQRGVSAAGLGGPPRYPMLWGPAHPGMGLTPPCMPDPSLRAVPGRWLLRGGPATSPLPPGQHRGAHVCPPLPRAGGWQRAHLWWGCRYPSSIPGLRPRVLPCTGTFWPRFPTPRSWPGSAGIPAVGSTHSPCVFFG